MLERAKHFLSDWAATNIQDEPYVRFDRPDPRPAALAARCKADAEAAGISEEDLCMAASDTFGAGSLAACMALEIDICAQKHLSYVGRLRA